MWCGDVVRMVWDEGSKEYGLKGLGGEKRRRVLGKAMGRGCSRSWEEFEERRGEERRGEESRG